MMTKAGPSGSIKDQPERSPRGEEMGKGQCLLIQLLECLPLEGEVWAEEKQYLRRSGWLLMKLVPEHCSGIWTGIGVTLISLYPCIKMICLRNSAVPG